MTSAIAMPSAKGLPNLFLVRTSIGDTKKEKHDCVEKTQTHVFLLKKKERERERATFGI